MIEFMYYIISVIALFVISVTMFARANDLRYKPGLKWNTRLLGFVMSGIAPVGIIGIEYATKTWPSPYETIFRVGLMLVFLTTPYLPPWWKWISGKDDSLPHWADDRRKPQ